MRKLDTPEEAEVPKSKPIPGEEDEEEEDDDDYASRFIEMTALLRSRIHNWDKLSSEERSEMVEKALG